MNKHALIISLGLLFLTGCSDLTTAQKEATEAVQNVSSEALQLKNNVETTATQVKTAIDSVDSAIDSVQDIGSEFKKDE